MAALFSEALTDGKRRSGMGGVEVGVIGGVAKLEGGVEGLQMFPIAASRPSCKPEGLR